jgi:hypothetical protein
MRFRSMLLSVTGFAVVAGGVAWFDPRVREKFAQLLHAGDGIASWDNRFVEFASAVVSAIRYQSVDNGAIMVFAAVGAVLFLFMVRT